MELAILLENYQHETLIFCTLPVLPLIRVTCYLIEISNIHPFYYQYVYCLSLQNVDLIF